MSQPQETATNQPVKVSRSAILGAIFLMATSAIGPGFITQTATFTAQMGAAFAFAIFVSILIDIAIQLNVWRMVTSSGKRAAQLASSAIPGTGMLLSVLIVIGGLAFNIGNIAGGGLGLNALLGIDPKLGGLLTGVLAIGIFLFKRAGKVVDTVVMVLGVGMIILTIIVAIVSNPPVGEAIKQSFLPDTINFATITTIVGGSVGGYITYSGAHRYLDSGKTGPEHAPSVMRSALTGILVTGVMRYVLFLAILGVVASGVALDLDSNVANPAGQAFAAVLGDAGMRIFGAIFWAAALTSVIGAAYTSATFLSAFSKRLEQGMAAAAGHGRIHHRLARHLPHRRNRTGDPARLRRRIQRTHPADRPDDLHVHRLVQATPASGRQIPHVVAHHRHRGNTVDVVHGRRSRSAPSSQ